MRSRVWLVVVGAGCAVGCGEKTRRPRPEPREQPTLPATCVPLSGLPATVLIDDFEDGDELLESGEGLQGLWYVENDGTGSQSPPAGERAVGSLLAEPGAPNSAAHALHVTVSGFRDWGAFVGVRLNAARTTACTVDASASGGLSFFARGEGKVRVNFGTPRTTPVGDGGECADDECSDFGAVVDLEEDWRAYELLFAELEQPSWAAPAQWEPKRLARLSFWAEQSDFELWLDEVRLF